MTTRRTRRSIGAMALMAAAGAAHAELPVYDAMDIASGSYRIVKRIWVDDWRSAFEVPRDGTREAALARLVRAAEEAGGDAVANAHCVRASDPPRGYFCYGNAVKLAPRR